MTGNPLIRSATPARSSAISSSVRPSPARLIALAWLCLLGICPAAWAAGDATQPIDWLVAVISERGLLLGLLAAFAGGLTLNLTPCVYPMIPVTLAFFSGQARGAPRYVVWLAFLYVAGISLSYAALGVFAAKTGALLGSWLQQPVVVLALAAVIIALALSLFGLYELRPPQVLLRRLGSAPAGPWGAFAMGLMVGLIAAPCVGPFLLGLMLLVSRLANPLQGFLLFFVLGLGMGLPSFLLALATQRVSRLPKAGAWLAWVKHALGLVLLGLALYFLRTVLPPRALAVLVPALLLGGAAWLEWIGRRHGQRGRIVLVRRLVAGCLIAAALLVGWPRPAEGPRVAWQPYTPAALASAQQQQRVAVIDLYADWCIPCVEMDLVTFRDPAVVRALADVATLRVDATREYTPEALALFERYDVIGVPTILLFDRQGRERPELRILGFVPAKEFLRRLGKLGEAGR